MDQHETTTLDQLSPGQIGVVVRIEKSSHYRKRLMEMGLIRGTPIVKVKLAPLADPAEYIVGDMHISLRREEARDVVVQPEDSRTDSKG